MPRLLPLVLVGLMPALLLSTACAQDGGDPAPQPGDTAPADDGAAAPAAPATDGIPADTEITETATGLKYSVLKKGTGTVRPKLDDYVVVHYTGWLTNGEQFDSSRDSGQPAKFQVGKVIEGWNEALTLMVAGDRFKLTIPSSLGYGPQGRPGIPGGATMIFDVELVDVISIPKFTPLDPEQTTTNESGLAYQVVRPGSGASPTEDQGVEFRYAFFTPAGQLQDCTETSASGQPIQQKLSDLSRTPFLTEGLALMSPGAIFRFSVPGKLMGGNMMQPDSVWQIELVQVVDPIPVPAFEMPSDDVLETTRSGLKFQVIREGAGTAPKLGQTVKVHYAGWLADGTAFDSSFGRGFPTGFELGKVIDGWNEGLQLMKPGGLYKFVIPSQLAYGQQQVGKHIKPGSTLVFLVELIEVEGQKNDAGSNE